MSKNKKSKDYPTAISTAKSSSQVLNKLYMEHKKAIIEAIEKASSVGGSHCHAKIPVQVMSVLDDKLEEKGYRVNFSDSKDGQITIIVSWRACLDEDKKPAIEGLCAICQEAMDINYEFCMEFPCCRNTIHRICFEHGCMHKCPYCNAPHCESDFEDDTSEE